MRYGIVINLVMITLASSNIRAATLSLRNEAVADSEIFMLVCETVNVEIVLTLEESETLGFANVFYQELVTDGAENALEVTHFFPEDDALADASRDRSSMPAGNPYPNGSGIAVGSYAMILGPANVTGPLTVVLDNVSIHATALGTVEVSFAEGLRTPGMFDPVFDDFTLLPPGVEPDAGLLSLGLGDARQGGVGPLIVHVVEEIPAPPIGNGNDNTAPSNDNHGGSNDNTSGGNGGGNGGGGSTSTGFCGLGMAGAFFLTGIILPLFSRFRRARFASRRPFGVYAVAGNRARADKPPVAPGESRVSKT